MRYTLAILFLFMSLNGIAQTFYLYHAEGNVTFSKEKAKPTPLKGGLAIEKGVTLNIAEGANVFVLNEKGLAVSINRPGKYTYEKIAAEIGKSTDVASPFFAHVWKKLREHHGHDPQSLANAPKGGVSRAEWVVYSLPDSTVIVNNALTVSWRPVTEKTYFTLADGSGKKEVKLALADTLVTLYPYEIQLSRGQYYQWTLSKDLAGKQGISGFILLPTTEWLDEFRKQEEQLIASLSKINDENFKKAQLDLFYRTQKVQR
jgi:hypothetical protein